MEVDNVFGSATVCDGRPMVLYIMVLWNIGCACLYAVSGTPSCALSQGKLLWTPAVCLLRLMYVHECACKDAAAA